MKLSDSHIEASPSGMVNMKELCIVQHGSIPVGMKNKIRLKVSK